MPLIVSALWPLSVGTKRIVSPGAADECRLEDHRAGGALVEHVHFVLGRCRGSGKGACGHEGKHGCEFHHHSSFLCRGDGLERSLDPSEELPRRFCAGAN